MTYDLKFKKMINKMKRILFLLLSLVVVTREGQWPYPTLWGWLILGFLINPWVFFFMIFLLFLLWVGDIIVASFDSHR